MLKIKRKNWSIKYVVIGLIQKKRLISGIADILDCRPDYATLPSISPTSPLSPSLKSSSQPHQHIPYISHPFLEVDGEETLDGPRSRRRRRLAS